MNETNVNEHSLITFLVPYNMNIMNGTMTLLLNVFNFDFDENAP